MSKKYSPCTASYFTPHQQACVDLADRRNARHSTVFGPAAKVQLARYSSPSFKTRPTRVKRKKATTKGVRSASRYVALYGIYASKKLVKSQLGLIHEVTASNNYGSSSFSFRRLYLDVYIEGSQTEFQLDSGADTSIISRDVLDTICPDWSQAPCAGPISLKSASQNKMNVVGTRWLNIGLVPDVREAIPHKFVIVGYAGQTLLSADFMYEMKLGIDWKDKTVAPIATWPSRQNANKLLKKPMYARSRICLLYTSDAADE